MLEDTINTIGWVALGFLPTLAVLELTWKMAYRIGKRDAGKTTTAATAIPNQI
jgi:uncharacterized membrane protein YfbV (UPF0208 family)